MFNVGRCVCVPDCDDNNELLILAATESGHLVVWPANLDHSNAQENANANVRRLALQVPNPVTALAVSRNCLHLVTGSCYSSYDFVRSKSVSSTSTLDRRTRGGVKTWNLASLISSKSDVDLAFLSARTASQMTSWMTPEQVRWYGVTCLALSDDDSLLAVGLASITTGSSSSSSSSSTSAVPAVVVVCRADNLETLWLADDLRSTSVHDAVFRCQPTSWSLFIATDTTVEMLLVTEKASQQMTGLTL